MEFNPNTPITDAQRQLASNKKVTLQPVHGDIAPNAISDAEIATRHIVEPAIANTTNDTEQAARSIQPSKEILHQQQPTSAKKATVYIIIAATLGLGTIGTAAVLFIL